MRNTKSKLLQKQAFKCKPLKRKAINDFGTKKILKFGKSAKNQPENWIKVYKNIAQMRINGCAAEADVDIEGCSSTFDKTESRKVQRFQILVSLMLSSQTKDSITAQAMSNLKRNLENGLNLESVLGSDVLRIEKEISKVGFYKKKAMYIKEAAERIKTDFSGDIPKNVEDLCSLKGVGEKMAYLAMQVAWNKVVGIGVDVHVNRISNRLGWSNKKHPNKTRKVL
ncbi:alpha,alpha-trehalase nth1, variant 4 [Bonamia ostreae]|uniref:Alpha,alpha-trehalase nth1, variant 4 n=1 Tax=Bonamia ostreae TaxID=126728 RepID=A0ABV2APA9_9EUKA